MLEDKMVLFESIPGAFGIYMEFENAILRRYPDTNLQVKKTQVSFSDGVIYALAWPAKRRMPETCIGISLCLPERIISPRITGACEAYPGRWTHHMLFSSPEDLDEELLGWLDTAHAYALFRTQKNRKRV